MKRLCWRHSCNLDRQSGARRVREWYGRMHTVTVTNDGFEYAGASYTSLTTITKKITGARWSAPRFFGLLAAGSARSTKGQDGRIRQQWWPMVRSHEPTVV